MPESYTNSIQDKKKIDVDFVDILSAMEINSA